MMSALKWKTSLNATEFHKMPPQKLSPRQYRAAELLASGKSVSATAKVIGTCRETVSKWHRLPEFQARLNLAKESQLEAIRCSLREAGQSAVTVMLDLLEAKDAGIRLKAAQDILDRLSVFDPQGGGNVFVGSTDPEDLRSTYLGVPKPTPRVEVAVQELERVLCWVHAGDLEPENVGLPFGIEFPMTPEEVDEALADFEELEAWAKTLLGCLDEAAEQETARDQAAHQQVKKSAKQRAKPTQQARNQAEASWRGSWAILNDGQVAGRLKVMLSLHAGGELSLEDFNRNMPVACQLKANPEAASREFAVQALEDDSFFNSYLKSLMACLQAEAATETGS